MPPSSPGFIFGKQGLWPGRRWRGIKGTVKAMRAIEYLQLDPPQIVARSHDIMLHTRHVGGSGLPTAKVLRLGWLASQSVLVTLLALFAAIAIAWLLTLGRKRLYAR